MLNRLREPFGKAGLIVAIVALVFAMLGGAYASNSGGGKATVSAKAKKGPRGPRGPKGDTGPQGPAGAAGSNGKDGANGANGSNGTPGNDGKSAEGIEFGPAEEPPAEPCGGRGGVEFKSAGPVTYACGGEEGSPWTAGGTLPPNETETGTWSMLEGGSTSYPLSFPIPLADPILEGHTHYILKNGKELVGSEEVEPTECGSVLNPVGTAANPRAAAGELCVYEANGNPEAFGFFGVITVNPDGSEEPEVNSAGIAGALISAPVGSPTASANGTWAVTAAP